MSRPSARARHAAPTRGALVPKHAAPQPQPLPRVVAGVGVALAVGLTVTGVQAAVTTWDQPLQVAAEDTGQPLDGDAREAEETSRLRTGDGVDVADLPERAAAEFDSGEGAGPDDPASSASDPASPAPDSEPEPADAASEPAPEASDPAPAPPDEEPAGGEELVAQFRDDVVELTNAERAAEGCGGLDVDDELATASQLHAEDMVTQQYFSHTGLDGSTPTDRANASGYEGGAGENIAAGQATPSEVVAGWMASEGHRANILNCDYTVIGVGYDDGRVDPDYGPGAWVQMFGFGE